MAVSDRSGVLWESMGGHKTNNSFDPDRCGNLTEEYTLVSHQYHQQKIRTSVATRALVNMVLKLWNHAIPDWRTCSKFREHGKHEKNGKRQPDDLKVSKKNVFPTEITCFQGLWKEVI